MIYASISTFYRFVLFQDPKCRQWFELICIYAQRYIDWLRPLIAFLTGFYVSQVVSRWWDQFMSLPWPESLAVKLVNFCPGMVRIFYSNLISSFAYVCAFLNPSIAGPEDGT